MSTEKFENIWLIWIVALGTKFSDYIRLANDFFLYFTKN